MLVEFGTVEIEARATAAARYAASLAKAKAKAATKTAQEKLQRQGVQYSLRAKSSGIYPDVRNGVTYLSKGDVWKYGV